MDSQFDEILQTAKRVAALIESLGQPEQQAVLELAETLRGYRQVSLALAERPAPTASGLFLQAPKSQP